MKKETLKTAKDSVADVIVKFRACEEWEECVQYVMEPERVRPLMEKLYTNNGYTSEEYYFSNVKESITKLKSNLYCWQQGGTQKVGDNYVGHGIYVVKTPDGYKIDWEATYAYNPIELSELENMPQGTTIEWRGVVNLETSNSNDWYNFFYANYNYELFTKKKTKIDQDITAIFRDGMSRMLTLKIKRSKDDTGAPFNEIVGVVSKNLSKY